LYLPQRLLLLNPLQQVARPRIAVLEDRAQQHATAFVILVLVEQLAVFELILTIINV